MKKQEAIEKLKAEPLYTRENKRYVVLVKYKQTCDSGHALLDDINYKSSQIVEVNDLLELNDMFKAILDVKILVENKEGKKVIIKTK